MPMPKKPRAPDPKIETLRLQGCLNPHPENVTDPVFHGSDFFEARDLVQVKYEMLRRVRVQGEPITESASAFGFSRPSFYQAQSAFELDGLCGLLPKKRGPRHSHKLSTEVVEYLERLRSGDPSLRRQSWPSEYSSALAARCILAASSEPSPERKKNGPDLDRRGAEHVVQFRNRLRGAATRRARTRERERPLRSCHLAPRRRRSLDGARIGSADDEYICQRKGVARGGVGRVRRRPGRHDRGAGQHGLGNSRGETRMNSEGQQKVTARHLARAAYLYVRQSTMRQVMENTESTERQYALRQRALSLGWPSESVVVIDSDLGKSGASAVDRDGFQKLVADVGLGRAGIVLGLEVSRLARNSTDWHRLLEICALTDTLILDEDGIYDPTHFNDRLLLGLKGTMSEAELHVLRSRLRGGLINKARRGELRCRMPIGFVYDGEHRVVLDPDTQVQESVRLLFHTFGQTGAAHATIKYFRIQGLLFPTRVHSGPRRGELRWGPLCLGRVASMLHNPWYSGAYAFGRSRWRKLPNGGVRRELLPPSEWLALIRDAHPGHARRDRETSCQARPGPETATEGAAERPAPARVPLGFGLSPRCAPITPATSDVAARAELHPQSPILRLAGARPPADSTTTLLAAVLGPENSPRKRRPANAPGVQVQVASGRLSRLEIPTRMPSADLLHLSERARPDRGSCRLPSGCGRSREAPSS